MQINIKGTNLDLTPEIKDYIFKKIGSLDKFLEDKERDSANVLFEIARRNGQKSGEIFHADCLIETNGEQFYASTDEADINQAIDEVRDILYRDLGRTKNKRLALFYKGARKLKDMMKSARDYRPWRK